VSGETVVVEVGGARMTIEPAGALLAKTELLEKRDVDPNVGGGVDRDKMPDSDFAGPDRSFPIAEPGDVSDAVSSLGRAKTDDAGRARIKARIIEIAHRKGAAYVAELPEEWKKEEKSMNAVAGKDVEAEVTKAADAEEEGDGKKPFPGAAEPFGKAEDADVEKAGDPDVEKTEGADAAKSAEAETPPQRPYLLKRLHDILCPAHSWEAVTVAYPGLTKDGVAASLGQGALAALYQMLAAEVAEDSGSGSDAHSVKLLSTAYADLTEFLKSEMWEAMSDGSVFLAAREELHGAFKAVNADFIAGGKQLTPPGPSSPPEAGQFRRPYIAAGRQRQKASPGNVPIPGAVDVPRASDFDRGPLSNGQQAQSPANKAAQSTSGASTGRELYLAAAKDMAAAGLQNLHDHLMGPFPDICPMELFRPGEMSGAAKSLDLRDVARPVARELAAPGMPAVRKAATIEKQAGACECCDECPCSLELCMGKSEEADVEKAEGVEVAKAEGVDGAAEKPPVDVAKAAATEEGEPVAGDDGHKPPPKDGEEVEKGADEADLTKVAMPELAKSIGDVATGLAALTRRIDGLASDVEALKSEPDPNRAPIRGIMGASQSGDGIRAEKTSYAGATTSREDAERRAFMERLSAIGGPYAHAAQEKIDEIGVNGA